MTTPTHKSLHESVVRDIHPGTGYTKEEEADLRTEYEAWPVSELMVAFSQNSFKADLLLSILMKRIIIE